MILYGDDPDVIGDDHDDNETQTKMDRILRQCKERTKKHQEMCEKMEEENERWRRRLKATHDATLQVVKKMLTVDLPAVAAHCQPSRGCRRDRCHRDRCFRACWHGRARFLMPA